MSDQIEKVEGKITFADGETVEFLLSDEGTTRWGNVTEVLGRAVEPTERMNGVLLSEGAYQPSPAPGDVAKIEMTVYGPTGAPSMVVWAHGVWREPQPALGREKPWIQLDISAVSDVLDAWSSSDPEHRSFRWPETDAPADPALVAFTVDGVLHMDEWPAVDDNEFDASHLIDGTLLPASHYNVAVRA